MPHANPLGLSNKPALLLADAAAYLGWSRRTLICALVRHGIPTTGSGRRARLLRADLELLKAKEPGNIRYQL